MDSPRPFLERPPHPDGSSGPDPAQTGSPRTVLLSGTLLVAALSALYWFTAPRIAAAGPELRVRLATLGRPSSLKARGRSLAGIGPDGAPVLASPRSDRDWELRAAGERLEDGAGRLLPQPLLLVADGPVTLEPEGRSWSGALEIKAVAGVLQVCNVLPLEDYLPGVIAGELGDAWPREALLAQAVAARTYAAWTRAQRRGQPFHLTDTTAFQVYRGHVEPGRPVHRAAQETRGLVLEAAGKLLPAWYSSTCGGSTAAAWEVFPAPPRVGALAGVLCPWCEGSKHHRWTAGPFSTGRLRALFGLPAEGQATGLEPTGLDASGRWSGARLVVPEQHPTLRFGPLRQALGLKSSLILQARWTEQGLLLEGGGWGHGVGLCQVGAARMAAAGHRHQEILTFYYPGATLVEAW